MVTESIMPTTSTNYSNDDNDVVFVVSALGVESPFNSNSSVIIPTSNGESHNNTNNNIHSSIRNSATATGSTGSRQIRNRPSSSKLLTAGTTSGSTSSKIYNDNINHLHNLLPVDVEKQQQQQQQLGTTTTMKTLVRNNNNSSNISNCISSSSVDSINTTTTNNNNNNINGTFSNRRQLLTPVAERSSDTPLEDDVDDYDDDNNNNDNERKNTMTTSTHINHPHHHHHHRHHSMQPTIYPVREFQFYIRGLHDPIVINPMVSLYGIATIWGVVIWTIVDPINSLDVILNLRAMISLHFTWLFIGSKGLFFFFLLWIAYRYGHVKLGYNHDTPEFTLLSYSCMIFATGVASGFFVFAVAEPLFHQNDNFFTNTGYRSQDEIDMMAINITVNNWGITGWTVYTIVAVCMSLATHRFHLPFTARSCFYPILHHYTWGWIGDLIDGLTIVISIGGICTSLGLGAAEIVTGLIRLGLVDKYSRIDHITSIQVTTTWVITIICTASVISGIHGGIRLLSLLAIAVGATLLCTVLLLDDTKFLLNLVTQQFGFFLQTSIFQLNFWTDAFGQLREGSGRAIDGKASAEWWMDSWTVFYQCWWISWAGFVGLMVARISRGRTLREVILHTLILPIVSCLVWLTIWGGIGLRQSRQGLELQALGGTFFNDTSHFLVSESEFCYSVPQEDVVVDGEVIFTNHLPGITPVCQFDSSHSNTASFNVLYSFSFPESFQNGGLGPTLSVVYILALTLFFVTSSDSGSLIVDHMASNGCKSHHWVRRMFWSITQGALATALLSSGGATALKAVQAMSILCGLPYIFLLIFMVQCTTLLCRAADEFPDNDDYVFPDQSEFIMPVYGGVFNIMEYISSLGYVNKARVEMGIDRPLKVHCVEFMKGVLIPFVSLYQILVTVYPVHRSIHLGIALIYAILYYSWIVLFLIPGSFYGYIALSAIFFVLCGAILGRIRNIFRFHYNNLRSNCVADFCSALLLWPQVLTQMRLHYIMIQQQTKVKVDEETPQPWHAAEYSDSLSLSLGVQNERVLGKF